MAGLQVLKVVNNRDVLGLGSSEEVLGDRIGARDAWSAPDAIFSSQNDSLVSKRDLDRALKAVHVPIVACALVRLVLLHKWDQLLRLPPLGLEVVIVGSRGSGVHLRESE